MDSMFSGAHAFNQPLNSWNVSSVTNMEGMFSEAQAFDQPLNSWNVSSVTNMGGLFLNAAVFNQDLCSWDVSSVTKMGKLFMEATRFNHALNCWNTSKVTDMEFMFATARAFNQPLDTWDLGSVTDMSYMFNQASDFNQDIGVWHFDTVHYPKFQEIFTEAASSNCIPEAPGKYVDNRQSSTFRIYCNSAKAKDGALCDINDECDTGVCGYSRCCSYEAIGDAACSVCTNHGVCFVPPALAPTWKTTTLPLLEGFGSDLLLRFPSKMVVDDYVKIDWNINASDGGNCFVTVLADGATGDLLPVDDISYDLRWIKQTNKNGTTATLRVGQQPPLDDFWDSVSDGGPGGIEIIEKSGKIYANPSRVGVYVAWLIATNAKGVQKSDGNQHFDQVLIKKWTVHVNPKIIFAVDPGYISRNKFARADVSSSLYDKQESSDLYIVGETYRFAPIEIAEGGIRNQDDKPNRESKLTFTLVDAPPGLLVNPSDGYMQGTPTTPGKSTMHIYAINDQGSRSEKPIQSIEFDIREGPNGKSCMNGGVAEAVGNTGTSCACIENKYRGIHCEISIVDEEKEISAARKETKIEKQNTSIFGSLGTIVVLLVAATSVYMYRARKLRLRAHDFESQLEEMRANGELPGNVNSSSIPREIKRSHVIMTNKIGQGGFGDVWKGLLDESAVGGVPGYLCAVKTTKDTDREGTAELLREAALMALVEHHANIVSLVGVVTSGTPLLLLITFCEHGALSSCLKRKRLPATKTRLSLCLDVARGMHHLATNSFIHRDLAARNVLLDSLWTGKVADFGLSRVTTASDSDAEGVEMYYKSSKGTFAVRWTAPDTMETLRYTTASDMWSFGVTLFEIYSDGARPYAAMDNAAVIKEVQSGYRLPQPESCPDSIFRVMTWCWDANPTARPSFAELRDVIAAAAEAEDTPSDALQSSNSAPGQLSNQMLFDFDGELPVELNYIDQLTSRVVTEYYETHTTGSPLQGLAQTRVVELRVAIAAAMQHLPCSNPATLTALEASLVFARNLVERGKSCGLTIDQAASIHLYTQESPLYVALNAALGGWASDGRDGIPHYLPYTQLAIGALKSLPSEPMIVYRGIRSIPLSVLLGTRTVGDILTWWSFTSTTGTSDVLRDSQFFGIGAKFGERTVFKIKTTSAVSIKRFSDFGMDFEYYLQPVDKYGKVNGQNEDEFLLMPGSTFVIKGIETYTNGVTEVELEEIESALPAEARDGGNGMPNNLVLESHFGPHQAPTTTMTTTKDNVHTPTIPPRSSSRNASGSTVSHARMHATNGVGQTPSYEAAVPVFGGADLSDGDSDDSGTRLL